jgi:hypothetical protein
VPVGIKQALRGKMQCFAAFPCAGINYGHPWFWVKKTRNRLGCGVLDFEESFLELGERKHVLFFIED